MEAPETSTHVAETSDMGDTHAMTETVTSEMSGTYAAAHVAQAIHAVADAVSEAAVVRLPAIKYGGVAVIAKVIRACRGTAVSRIVHRPRRAGVPVGIGLGSSRLRSSKRSDGQPNAGSQQDRFGRKLAAGHRSLLWGFAPQFKLIAKWDLGGICGAASSQAAPRYWQKFLPGS
jgi:hypothetical protein